MAVYTVSDSVQFTQAICSNIPVDSIKVIAADSVNSIMWNCYPWRWAQKAMTAIPLVDGTQDYTFAPTDFMRLVAARLVQTSSTPDTYDELTVVRNLAPDLGKSGFMGGLTQIATVPATSKLRLTCAAAVATGQTFEIQGEYQFQPAKITSTGASLAFPDQYFGVFNEGLLWMFYRLSKDSREGSAQANGKGGVVYTGQMGAFFDALMSMREAEDWGAGDNVFPSDPLGVSGGNYSGLYGF
jgi:hypothetical protein